MVLLPPTFATLISSLFRADGGDGESAGACIYFSRGCAEMKTDDRRSFPAGPERDLSILFGPPFRTGNALIVKFSGRLLRFQFLTRRYARRKSFRKIDERLCFVARKFVFCPNFLLAFCGILTKMDGYIVSRINNAVKPFNFVYSFVI